MSSADNEHFEQVGKMDANALQTQYQFKNKLSYNGINYYKLQVVEKNETAYFSKVVGIVNSVNATGIHFTTCSVAGNNIGVDIASLVKQILNC